MSAGARSIVVQKYGGTSVATPERIRAIADRIAASLTDDPHLVVVLSAMGKTTDGLVALAHEVAASPKGREMDLLLATGSRSRCPCSVSRCRTREWRRPH